MQYNTFKFANTMNRWEKNRNKMTTIGQASNPLICRLFIGDTCSRHRPLQLMNPTIQLFNTVSTMMGYFYGGQMIMAGESNDHRANWAGLQAARIL